MKKPAMSFHVGEDLGDYRIVSILGAGSMGQVFQVEHRNTGRKAAAKVLLADVSSDRQFLRFLREIEVQGRLNHPNIARVHNALHFKNSLILVMEMVEGRSLEKLLLAGGLPQRAGLDYIRQTLSALAYAHARGVVHRDVTPGNLIVSPEGRVKLTDFGLAKSLGDHQLTNDGDIVGSLHYMPPEQVRRHSEPDPRSDIYSTGAVLYEIITGKKLFEYTDRLSLMVAQVQKQPIQPIDIDPGIGPELNAIVLKALAKEPDRRYQSAEEFLAALESATKSRGFAPSIASGMRVVTLVLAACAMAETGGVDRMPIQASVPLAIQPIVSPVVAPIVAPIVVPAVAPAVLPFNARSHDTGHMRHTRAQVLPPIEAQMEKANETIVEPEPEPTEVSPATVSEPSAEPTPQAFAPTKKRFWSKLNPFKRNKPDRPH
jgi:eukaryotic-like serine/threonine-protein kinase